MIEIKQYENVISKYSKRRKEILIKLYQNGPFDDTIQIAKLLGYPNINAANLQIGNMGRAVSEATGIVPKYTYEYKGEELLAYYTLIHDRFENGWGLQKNLKIAIENLGWIEKNEVNNISDKATNNTKITSGQKTFLFAWNPKKWKWETLQQSIDQIEQTGQATEKWSVISHRKIQPGDKAFLMRLGDEPKGIMAAGFVSTVPFLSKHWSGEGKSMHCVMINFEVILDPGAEPLLSLDILNQGNLANVNWTPQSSGIEIAPEIADELEAVWFDFLTTNEISYNHYLETEIVDQTIYLEGMPNQVVITKYERNPYARKICIDHYGLSCAVCKFNFEETYGEIGKNFIHVHHLTQVATIGKEYTIDPVKDLRPVCPNCHSMLHKRYPPLTIEELKELISK